MKAIGFGLVVALFSASAFAGNVRAVPEIDGGLSLLMIALVGGLALVLKKGKD